MPTRKRETSFTASCSFSRGLLFFWVASQKKGSYLNKRSNCSFTSGRRHVVVYPATTTTTTTNLAQEPSSCLISIFYFLFQSSSGGQKWNHNIPSIGRLKAKRRNILFAGENFLCSSTIKRIHLVVWKKEELWFERNLKQQAAELSFASSRGNCSFWFGWN